MQQKANGKNKIKSCQEYSQVGRQKKPQSMQIGSKSWGEKGVYKLLP